MVFAQILAPMMLPVLQLVTLATLPATAVYALLGLIFSPIIIPLIVLIRVGALLLFSPLLLLTLPVSIPVGGVLAFLCTVCEVLRSLFVVFTPFLWPLCFLMKWWRLTCLVSQVIIKDSIMPWLVPIRFTFLAALLPHLLFH